MCYYKAGQTDKFLPQNKKHKLDYKYDYEKLYCFHESTQPKFIKEFLDGYEKFCRITFYYS